MFHQKCLQNCLLIMLMLLAVYIIKAGMDPLCVFSTNYYNKYPKMSKMVQDCGSLTHPFFAKLL